MNTQYPLVSIIIPTYNRAHLIGETLDSVMAQTYKNWECIIVDDGSSDNTDEVVGNYVKKDPRFKYYHRPDAHKPGGNGARNYGFEVSRGEYVQWFDSDDLMLEEKLELKVKVILENDVDFVVCENAEIVSVNPYQAKKKWPIKVEGDVLLNHLKTNIAFGTAGPMFKKSFLKTVKNLFDEEVKIGQEWEFYSRLLTQKPSIGYIFKSLYHFRNEKESIRFTITNEKYINRSKTNLKLFSTINKSGYYNKLPKLKYEYNQFKLYWTLRRFKYLRKNISVFYAIRFLIKGLSLISMTYLLKNTYKSFKDFSYLKNLLKRT